MDPYLIGETAAIFVSLFWSFCSIFFTWAGRRVGPLSVNIIRIFIAVGLLSAAHIVIFGTVVPQANRTQWFYMGLSGVIGLALGDFSYFGSLVMLGPRRGVLLMATNPIFSAIGGYLVLHQVLSVWTVIGICVTLSGVLWVVLENEENSQEKMLDRRTKTYGVLLGIGGSVGQGIGVVLSKYGMDSVSTASSAPLNPLSATLIRMVIAAIFIFFVILLLRKLPEVHKAFSDRKAIGATFGGAVLGPFLGVWMSMVAITYVYVGIASTLMSLMPVMVIPIVWILYKQKTSWRGIVGAIIAIIGVGILFLIQQ